MPPASLQIALDTNFLLDLASKREVCWECVEIFREAKVSIIVTPTVLQELTHLVQVGDIEEGSLATIALTNLVQKWRFQPLNFIPVGQGIVEAIADKIRSQGLLPLEEKNDSYIIAEAALSECDLIISSDHHLTDIDSSKLSLLLEQCHVKDTKIYWPQRIAKNLRSK